jgi:hypothetical protein
VADQPGAEQRRGGDRIEVAGEAEGEAGVGQGVAGEAPVALVAGEAGPRAEVLAPRPAALAAAAAGRQPGDPDPITG